MCFRKLPQVVSDLDPIPCPNFCFATGKQSSNSVRFAGDEERKPEHDQAQDEYLEVGESSEKRGEGRNQTEDIRIILVTRAVERSNSPAKHGRREGRMGGTLERNPTTTMETDTFHCASRISHLDHMETNPCIFQNQNRAECALNMLKPEHSASELVGKIG
ncbi:unnamed protein product [Linum trigynum]|uniref:Uncharacterized protein n=1 Tax=Linum trigynum TaxID=586398 RepID=A0AAV2GAA8_9ROSI